MIIHSDYSYHSDQLGSVLALTDSDNNIFVQYNYDAFGNMKVYDSNGVETTVDNSGSIYGYAGMEIDKESPFYYYRARNYSPAQGRFLTLDPIGFLGKDFNLYRYAWNSPVTFSDPYGLWGFYVGYKLQAVAGLWKGGGLVAGLRGIVGSEGDKINLSFTGNYTIPSTVLGASRGRGFEIGFFLFDVSDFKKATEHSFDTPWGGVSLFFNDGFFSGFGIGGKSKGVSYTQISPNAQPNVGFDFNRNFKLGGEMCTGL